jgi:recombinational DNA repair ATPase RecF
MFKNVLDFLHDWAEEQGIWAKLLVQCIISKEKVSQQQREEIYGQFLIEIGASGTLKSVDTNETPYIFTSENFKVLLESISSVMGVNKLAPNQEMEFSENLTVIYGNNGSGKTGYSRILKSLGFSYDKNTKILPNVFNTQQTETEALIKYKMDNDSREFHWRDQLFSDDLSNIGVFNSECVKLSLDGKRNFIATPKGFHLFNLVASELEILQNILSEEVAGKGKKPPLIEKLIEGTEVYKYIQGINHESSKEEFDAMFNFSEDDDSQLQSLDAEKEKLNKHLIANEIDSVKKNIGELKSLIIRIEEAKEVFNKTFWINHFFDISKLKGLEGMQQKGIEDIVKNRGVSFYQTEQFKKFITAAENYIKIINKPEYPGETDSCIYCQQPLDINAKALLKSYRTLLNDNTKADIELIRNKINENIRRASNIKTDLVLNYEPFGLKEDETLCIPDEIIGIFHQIEGYKKLVLNSVENEKIIEFTIDYKPVIDLINTRLVELSISLESKLNLLSSLEQKEKEIVALINGLRDSKKVSENKQVIFGYIGNLKYANLLEKNKVKFNTRGLSQKSSKARKELIEHKFQEIFDEEIKRLKCPSTISLNFGTQKSNPRIEQNINNQYSLQEVFSEGEQKSVALANFITELRVSEKKDPIIFDDPVNSLDHERINIVAKRLLQLSLERQVIIFTHNVLLFYALEQIIKDSKMKLAYNYYTVEKDLEFTGYLYENVPPHKESFRTYETKINKILNSSKEERRQRESKLAQEGYNYLRSAIELLVEDEIFKNVVKRYKRNITFGQFEKVNGTNLDQIKEELTEVFNQCCCYIEAHSNPEELAELPTLEQLNQDFDSVKVIRKLFL